MNAQEYLNQAYMLDQRIRSMLQQVAALRSLATSVKSFAAHDKVVHDRNVTAMEDTVIKIIEQEAEINAEIDRLVDLKKEIRETISEVQEMNMRLVLEKRYLCFLPFARIAEDLGHTERWAQIKNHQGLIVVQQILDRRAA